MIYRGKRIRRVLAPPSARDQHDTLRHPALAASRLRSCTAAARLPFVGHLDFSWLATTLTTSPALPKPFGANRELREAPDRAALLDGHSREPQSGPLLLPEGSLPLLF